MKRSNAALLGSLRKDYHGKIRGKILGHRPGAKGYTVADSSSKTSCDLAERMVMNIGLPTCSDPDTGQTAGKLFTDYTMEFLEGAFAQLRHLRPGEWIFSPSQAAQGIALFDQYAHLAELQKVLDANKELKAALGGDYLVTPDIIVAKHPVPDQVINDRGTVIQDPAGAARYTPFRAANTSLMTLHASISCKWTIRSDRAQNTRTEALNLIRNRKGKVPHIVCVTMEPLRTRLASIAMGTGDLDCTYHAALYELENAVIETGNEDQAEMLQTLVGGRRLRDISDLPFDLAL
jgi:hypothetical protein